MAAAAPLAAGTIDFATRGAEAIVYGREAADTLTAHAALASGDWNDDGIPDLVIGQGHGDGPLNARREAGEAYVFFGPITAGADFDLATSDPDVLIYADAPTQPSASLQLGFSVAGGDVSGDGIDDLILGVPGGEGRNNDQSFPGEIVILFGPFARGSTLDLESTPADLVIYGGDPGDRLGMALVVADISGDGVLDLVGSATWADGLAGPLTQVGGRVYGWFGPLAPGILELAVSPADLTLYGTITASSGDQIGTALAVADLSGDGVDDLVLAARADGPSSSGRAEGEVRVMFGPFVTGTSIDFALRTADVVVAGADLEDELGWRLAAGDLSGDGQADLVAAAVFGDGAGNARSDAGEVHVLLGPLAAGTAIDLGTVSADWMLLGADAADNLGFALAIGDTDLDGNRDLVVGAPKADGVGNARLSGGEVFVFRAPLAPGVVDLAVSSPDTRLVGGRANDWLGCATAVLDVSGDSVPDLVLGAYNAQGFQFGTASSGRAILLLGPLGGGCAAPASAVAGLQAVRAAGGDVELDWAPSGDPAADHYNVWRVVNRDPQLIARARKVEFDAGTPGIEAVCAQVPALLPSCSDAGAVSRPPELVFYQVRAACVDGREGP